MLPDNIMIANEINEEQEQDRKFRERLNLN